MREQVLLRYFKGFLMHTTSAAEDNNRPNAGNQSSRHHHTSGAGSSYPADQALRQDQQTTHEYYPEFDQTGKGINPEKRITKHSR